MRCPKCGYISFDHVETCPKCTHGLASLAQDLRGAAVRVEPPFFLGSVLGEERREEFAGGPEAVDLATAETDVAAEDESATADEEMSEIILEEEEVAVQEMEERSPESTALSGIDVSDLMPSQEEAAGVLGLDEEVEEEAEAGQGKDFQEESGLELPEETGGGDVAVEDPGGDIEVDIGADEGVEEDIVSLEPETVTDRGIDLDEDVVDLSALVDTAENSDRDDKRVVSVGEDLTAGTDAGKGVLDQGEEGPGEGHTEEEPEFDLTLDVEEDASLGGDAQEAETPDIPDLGLSLEVGGEDEEVEQGEE